MKELLDIFDEREEKVGILSKKDYYSQDGDVPWIKCCSCFVIESSTNRILFEKRGNRFLDPGKLDLCSGHIRSQELPSQAMARELVEELGVDKLFAKDAGIDISDKPRINRELAEKLKFLGKVKVDYTKLSDETNRKKLKCFVYMYALKLRSLENIDIDHREVVQSGLLSISDSIGFIENSMTRLPYEKILKNYYDNIFKNLEHYIDASKLTEDIVK